VQNEHNEGDGPDDFPLEDPIIEWKLTDCTHQDFPSWAYNVLSPIVKIESNNFKYGRFNRFETIAIDTYRFDVENPIEQPIIPSVDLIFSPPGDSEAIMSTMEAVIRPFAYLMANKNFTEDKSESLLRLRTTLRELDFDPDPNDEWTEIAKWMKEYYQ
jgi:hypothetical protein